MASFETAPNKTWSVRFRVVEEGALKNKRLSGYETKRAAREAYVDFIAKYVAPSLSNGNNDLTFSQLYGKYQQYVSSRLKTSSIYSIESLVQNHIIPTFGAKPIAQITKRDIFDWQEALNKQKYAYSYKKKLRGTFSTILKFAIQNYDLPGNVVLLVENFRNTEPKREMSVYSPEEFKSFINVIENDVLYKTFFMFLYLTGCRKGEVFSLNWNEIDFDTNMLNISKTLNRKTKQAVYEISPTPKTSASNRRILLPSQLIENLKEYKSSLKKVVPTDFVFGGKAPLSEMTVTRKLDRYSSDAGLKRITAHDFRHSHASLLISMGESIVMVSKRLGHSDIEQTLNTYSHLMPNQEAEMIHRLNIL